MVVFLAVIGAIFLLGFVSKALLKIGDVFESVSKNMEERALSATQLKREQIKATKSLKKEMRKLRVSNDGYKSQLDKEIEEMTK